MKYRIEADSRSWNLSKAIVVGENSKEFAAGTIKWVPFHYYARLEDAARGLLDQLTAEHTGQRADTQAIIVAAQRAAQDVLEAVADLESRGVPTSPQKAREAA